MAIRAQCPACGGKFQAPDKLSGRRVKCPNCSAVISLGGARQKPSVRQPPPRQEAPQGSAPSTPPGAERAQWYLKTADGQQLGPMSKGQLDALVAEGRLDGFCRLRRQDWEQWKWAEAVYPQFALLVDPDAPKKDRQLPAGPDAQGVAAGAESPLHPCPDCGKMVSRRAGRCPNCGCPLVDLHGQPAISDAPAQVADEIGGVAPSSQKSGPGKRTPPGLMLAAAVSVLLLVAVGGLLIGWQLWRKVNTVLSGPEQQLQSLAERLAAQNKPLQQPTAQRNAKEMKGKAATPEEIEQYIQETAAGEAKRVDQAYRSAFMARSLFEKTEQTADLLRSLEEGHLEPPPKTKPKPPAKAEKHPYQSQYQPLYNECLAYLRKNISAGELDRSKVRDLADRWTESKLEPLKGQLEDLQRQLGL
jgi:hypothetical protein